MRQRFANDPLADGLEDGEVLWDHQDGHRHEADHRQHQHHHHNHHHNHNRQLTPPDSPSYSKRRRLLGAGGRPDPRGLSHLMDPSSNDNLDSKSNSSTSWIKLVSEAFPSVILSLGGLILTGSLLDHLQRWSVFVKVTELFILVPTLLGLKGNLEMNLASRLSTAANLGYLDTPKSRWKLVGGNIALLQIQSACVSGLASAWSLTLGGIVHNNGNNAAETALICASGILTASVASMILGTVMCCTVIVCRMIKVDPDNIATPVAASLGDLITLLLLAAIATMLHSFQ
ncbi:hypothetical protein HDU76_003423, partial [Blyttiomyces sp. JEL0837]